MNTYLGSRTVLAKPLTSTEFAKHMGRKKPVEDVEGFMLEDPKGASNHPKHKGSLHWLPKLNFNAEFYDLGYLQDHTPRVQRIHGEIFQLNQKLEALKTFLKTPMFLKLSFAGRDLLQEQSRIMTRYVAILEDRLTST